MGELIQFPRAKTTTINDNERHIRVRLQESIKSVRNKYYNENLEIFEKYYAYSLMVQRVVEFMHKQWVVHDNKLLARLPPSK